MSRAKKKPKNFDGLTEQTGADGATLALDRDGGTYALWVRGCCIEIRCMDEPERTWIFRAPVDHPWVAEVRAWLGAGVPDERFCATVVFEILGW